MFSGIIDEGVLQRLRQEIAELQQKIATISNSRGGGNSVAVTQMEDEQMQAKDRRLQELELEKIATRERAEQTTKEMKRKVEELERERKDKKLQLQTAQSGVDISEAQLLKFDIDRTEGLQNNLRIQLAKLEGNAFISTTGDRIELAKRVLSLEEALQRKNSEHDHYRDEFAKADTERTKLVKERLDLDARCQEIRVRHEQLRLDLEAQDAHMERIERDARILHDQLPLEQQKALEHGLSELLNLTAPSFAVERVSAWSRTDLTVPSAQDLQSGDAMERIVERLRGEKEELRKEIEEVRKLVAREEAISHEVKVWQQDELAGKRQEVKQVQQERQKWERLAGQHLNSLKDLQRQLARIDAPQGLLAATGDVDTASSAGFSDLSDMDGAENSLDVFLAEGEIEPAAILRSNVLSQAGADLRTMVCAELKGFDSGYTEVALGASPRYDSLVSFGPFVISDAFLDHLFHGSLGLELRVSSAVDGRDFVLGRGQMPLAALLQSSHLRRNPVICAAAQVFDIEDPAVRVACVRVKMHFRYSIEDEAEDFMHRFMVAKSDRDYRLSVDARLADVPHPLLVQVHKVTGLPPSGRDPEALRPYVFYQLPRTVPRFTRTSAGPYPIFNDNYTVPVVVDADFCHWVEHGKGLHLIVFDDAASPPPAAGASKQEIHGKDLGLVGEVAFSLRPLMRDALHVIEGAFTLRADLTDPASPAAGMIYVTVCWPEFSNARALQQQPPPPPPQARPEEQLGSFAAQSPASLGQQALYPSAPSGVAAPYYGQSGVGFGPSLPQQNFAQQAPCQSALPAASGGTQPGPLRPQPQQNFPQQAPCQSALPAASGGTQPGPLRPQPQQNFPQQAPCQSALPAASGGTQPGLSRAPTFGMPSPCEASQQVPAHRQRPEPLDTSFSSAPYSPSVNRPG